MNIHTLKHRAAACIASFKAIACLFAIVLLGFTGVAQAQIQAPPQGQSDTSPSRLEAAYHAAWQIVGEHYYDVKKLANWKEWEHKFDGQLKDEQSLQHAVKAMVDSLDDPQTVYQTPTEAGRASAHATASEEFAGVIVHQEHPAYVQTLTYGLAAYDSDLRPGDKLISVGGILVDGKSKAEIEELFFGKVGSRIAVEFETAKGAVRQTELLLQKRTPLNPAATIVNTVNGEKVLYIHLPSLELDKLAGMDAAIDAVLATTPNPSGVILDLRGNEGGAAQAALYVGSQFVEKGVLWQAKTRLEKSDFAAGNLPNNLPSDLARRELLRKLPLVVLVNGSTGGAAESLTEALTERKRTYTVVGTNTLGEGVGHDDFPVPNTEMTVQISTVLNQSPAGQQWQDTGLRPPEYIEQPRDVRTDAQLTMALQAMADALTPGHDLLPPAKANPQGPEADPDRKGDSVSADEADKQLLHPDGDAGAPAEESVTPGAKTAPHHRFYLPHAQTQHSGGKWVALTFDDGPSPTYTPQVLDILKQYGIHATFCLVGEQVQKFPKLVERIVQEGHQLCDHTMTHDEFLPLKPDARIQWEILETVRVIHAASPGTPIEYYRAPGGSWTPHVAAQVKAWGMENLGWSCDSEDWKRPGVQRILDNIKAELRPGGVILMHDAGGPRDQTIAALKILIPYLIQQGYQFDFPE